MPRVPLPPEVDAFLRRPNQAVLGLLRPSGAPHTLATWYDWDGRELLVNTETGRTGSAGRLRTAGWPSRPSTPRASTATSA